MTLPEHVFPGEADRYRLAWLSARRRAWSNRRYAAELVLAIDEVAQERYAAGYSDGYWGEDDKGVTE